MFNIMNLMLAENIPATEYLSVMLRSPVCIWGIRLTAAAIAILLFILYKYYTRKIKRSRF